ncbi:MAG: hypothetical protein E7643_08410 [Ruminococcaceae bacterium]|nr:hypothetical protein [Oscillospiraceae bacterium]
MQFKVRRKLGLALCIPAFLFLFNPVIAFVDFLPDAIGYALLLLGLRQVADVSGRLEESRSNFKKMLYVSLGAIVAEYYLYSVLPGTEGTVNAYETPVWILLCSFVMLAFHIVFLLPAYRELFLGLGVLCEECEGRSLASNRKGKSRYERLSTFSAVFAVLTAALSCIPEISVLTPFEVEAEKMTFDWYVFVGLFRIIFGVLSLIIGVVWLIRVTVCFIALLRDKPFTEGLEARYAAEMLPKRGILTLRRVGVAFAFLMVGAIFIADIRFDFRSVLPTPVCALLFCAALPFLGSFFEKRRYVLISAGLLLGCGIFQILLRERYLDRYTTFEHSLYSHDAYRELCILQGVQIAEAVLILLLVGSLLFALLSMVKRETAEIFDNDRACVSARSTARLHKKFKRLVYLCGGFFLLFGAARITEILMLVRLPLFWVISLAFSLVAIGMLFYLLFAVKDQLEWQYSAYDLNKIPRTDAYLSCNPNSNTKEYNQHAEQQSEQLPQQSEQQSEQ